MAALFDGSTSFLSSISPANVPFPYTVACWFQVTVAATAVALTGQSNNTVTNQYWFIGRDTSDHINLQVSGTGGTTFLQGTVAIPINSWVFVVARMISATSRRVAVLHPGGVSEHISQATSNSPSGLNRQSIGVLERTTNVSFFPGLVGEVWGMAADVQPDGGQLDDNILRALAYRGPFALPHLISSLQFYHAMRSSLPSLLNEPSENYSKGAPMVWSATGVGIPAREHPPLPYEYARPKPVSRMIMI
jgi:hypothetical protein